MATNSEINSHLSRDFVDSIIIYDPITGYFSRKVQRGRFAAGAKVGRLHRSGYINLSIKGRSFSAHRVAGWFLMTGRWPKEDIDHIDRNRSNNSWSNLREATRSQNCRNVGPRKSNHLRITGVSEFRGTFIASVTINGKQKNRKFTFIEDAINWRRNMEIEHYGDFSPSLTRA